MADKNNKKPAIDWLQVIVQIIAGLITGAILLVIEKLIN